MPTKTCHRCGKPFDGYTIRRRFCGPCYSLREYEEGVRRHARWTPERRRAGVLVQSALYHGKLIRQPCEVCGTTEYVQAHHDDYSKPLDVRWLCRSHHKQHHNKFGSALNAFVEAAS